ncbi:MAG: hypothetical protein QNJ20_00205 [Paracoccaceae bacterium]|nr:hypothetical protein [Paracoccaceae bacterium]
MSDNFANRMRSPGEPAVSVFDITPDNATDLPQVTTALNVATPGTVRVTALDGSISDLHVAHGTVFPIRATRVWESGTTATGIKGLL